MAGQNIKGRGQRPNSLEGGGARYLKSYTTAIQPKLFTCIGPKTKIPIYLIISLAVII